MKSTPKLLTKPFDIFVPATENRKARKVATIEVQVYMDEEGDEVLTPESLDLIDKTQARYMGLLMGEDIRAMRERLGLPQDELSDLLGCGKKSLSRWENGHGYPSQLVNTLLRALDEGLITPGQLRGLQQPRTNWADILYAHADPPRAWYISSSEGLGHSERVNQVVSEVAVNWRHRVQRSADAPSRPSIKPPSTQSEYAECPALKRGQFNLICFAGS